jgi:hypothetical protein
MFNDDMCTSVYFFALYKTSMARWFMYRIGTDAGIFCTITLIPSGRTRDAKYHIFGTLYEEDNS